MDKNPRPLQRRKAPRITRKRRANLRRHEWPTPTDLLRLLPSPIMLPDRSLTDYARQLDRRRERIRRLTARFEGKGFVEKPRQVHVPKLAKLEAVEREIALVPTKRRLLTISQFRIYMDGLRQVRSAIAGLKREVQEVRHRARQDRYLVKLGRLVTDAPDDVFETFILSRRNKAGRNLHASALARMKRADSRQLSEWGKRGAAETNRRRRERELNAAAAPTPSQSESAPSEVSTAPEPESA